MGKTFKVGSGSLPLIPPGEYSAIFAGSEDTTTRFGDAIKLKFQIDEGEHEDTVLHQLAKPSLTPSTKLGKTISALMGESLRVNTDIDLDSFMWASCLIVVKTVHGTTGDYSTIEEVKPKPRTS